MPDVTTIARVAGFSFRNSKSISVSTSGQATTLAQGDPSDFINFPAAVCGMTLTLPPIMNNVQAKKIDSGYQAVSGSGSVFTLNPGTNPDTGVLDTINNTTTYSLTSGKAIVIESEIGHNWRVFSV